MGTNESKLTSADYRSAAKKVRGALLETELGPHIESLAVLGIAHMEAEADRLDAEKATETESFEFLNELALAFRAAENHPRPQCAPVLEGVRAVLAHLDSTDRLIPAGGMALTAEQVEDVRIVLGLNGSQDIKVVLDAQERLRARFPATEPAEPATQSAGGDCFDVCEGHPIADLIAKSSLGTESAQALINTVSPEHGRRIAEEAARREAGTKVKLTELQRDLLQKIVDQWAKGAGWTHVFWSGTVEALISAGCIVRHEEAFNEYRPTISGEKALAPAEPAEEVEAEEWMVSTTYLTEGPSKKFTNEADATRYVQAWLAAGYNVTLAGPSEPAEEETKAETASHCWDMEAYAAGTNAGFDEAMRQTSGVDVDDELTEPWSRTEFAVMSEVGDRVFEIDWDRGGTEEALDCIVGGRLVTRDVYYGAWRLADAEAVSSPVVPAPTETEAGHA